MLALCIYPSPSLMETTLLSSSLILMQVTVGHSEKSVWNLFQAPSSGKATVGFSSLGIFRSSRISSGIAVNSLERGVKVNTSTCSCSRFYLGEGGGSVCVCVCVCVCDVWIGLKIDMAACLPWNHQIRKVKSFLESMNVKDEYLSRSPRC